MKKAILLALSMIMFAAGVFAQLRAVPASVTDAFKSRYPHAENVAWKDKLTNFTATFNLNNTEMTAEFSNKGEWRNSEAKITYDALPASVQDGFKKSKYADWKTGSVTEIQRMGKGVQYRVYVEKSEPFQKKFLYFDGNGKLTRDPLGV